MLIFCTEKLPVPILVSLDQTLTHQYADKILYLRLCFRSAKECARKGETVLMNEIGIRTSAYCDLRMTTYMIVINNYILQAFARNNM